MTIGSSRTVTGTKSPDALELIGPRHQLPGAAEDPLLLALEDVGVEVVARRAASRRG